jgi:hypothetical protein
MIHTLFLNNGAVVQDNSRIHTAGIVQVWFKEHEGELQHFPWAAQSPDLNIIELLLSVSETRMRNRFPPQISLKQFEDVLQADCYKIPLETVQNLCEFISRSIAAILKAKYGPTPY